MAAETRGISIGTRISSDISMSDLMRNARRSCVLSPRMISGVAGYVVGVADTRPFEARLERDWWPALRARYPDPGAVLPPDCDADTKRAHRMHHTAVIPDAVVAEHPGHLHMNLLPRLQRQGVGSRLLERWFAAAREAGAERVHVGVNPGNPGGLAFWQRAGFARIALPAADDSGRAIWLGRPVP